MDVIGHEAVSVELAAKFAFPLFEVVEIIEIVVIASENGLAVMAPLDDMVRAVRKDQSGVSRHEKRLPCRAKEVKNKSVPFFPECRVNTKLAHLESLSGECYLCRRSF